MAKTKTKSGAAPAPSGPPAPKSGKQEKLPKPDLSSVEGILASQQGLLYRGREAPGLRPEVISTGIFAVDRVLGVGGFPRGRIVEVVGNTASGKTTLCLQLIAAAQAQGHECAFIDAEHALDEVWATSRGVDMDNLVIGKPEWGEQALTLVEDLCETFKIGLIVVDSVAALIPKKELEGDIGDSSMGLHAKLMSQAMRKLTSLVAKSNTCVVFTNQYRSSMSQFGPGNVTTGGNALKYYASIRIETTNVGKIKVGGGDSEDAEVIGNDIRVTVIKNKLGRPWQMTKVPLMHDTGYDNVASMFELAKQAGLDCIKQDNTVMWSIFGEKVRGRPAAVAAARKHEARLAAALTDFYATGTVGYGDE